MQDQQVLAEVRTKFGKGPNRRLRLQGKIPGVVYGRGLETTPVSVDPGDLLRILHSDSGKNTIFQLQYGDNSRDVIIQEFQVDPVKGALIHADFHALAMDEVHAFQVPVEVRGESMGVKAGGILDVVMHTIELECLPADLPDHLVVDVTSLQIGDSIRVEQLQVDKSKITILSDEDQVVVTVVHSAAALPEEGEEEEEEAVEPEVIKKGKAVAEEEESES